MATVRRAHGDGTLFKRADGMWIGGIEVPTADGKRRRKTVSSKDRNVAIRKLRELRREIDAGRVPTTPTTTVEKWLEHWLKTIHGPQVRPTTYKYYEQAIRLHINPCIGGKRLDRLTPEDVRTMHRAVQEKSTRSAQQAHQALQAALKDAVNEGILVRNVAAAVAKPRHAPALRGAFSLDVAKHILQTAIASGDEMAATRWAAAFLTGARQGELLGLTWDRVDLTNGVMDLAWQLQQLQKVHGCGDTCGKSRPGFCPQARWNIPPGFEMVPCHRSLCWTRPKTKAGTRIVPIAVPLLAMLQHLPRSGDNPHQLVWHHPDGRPISPKEDHEAWKALLEKAGVEAAPLHSARHTTASLLHAAGVDEQTRMQIMGQSSAVAHRGYVHLDQSQTRLAVSHLNELLGGES